MYLNRNPLALVAGVALLCLAACSGPATEGQPAGDTTPPAIPTGLASSGNTQTAITLTWSASTDEAGGSG